jgi:allantoicase
MTAPFTDLVDLASDRYGGAVVIASDEFFAEKDNLLKPTAPVWKEDAYTDRGKWMDGWESRRRFGREEGPDFCIIRLGVPGILRGAVIDTSNFRGNYPDACDLAGADIPGHPSVHDLMAPGRTWTPILPRTELRGDFQNTFAIDCPWRFTHVRMTIHPDGGIARVRLHGEAVPEWARHGGLDKEIDLASAEIGGAVIACSDMFFGSRHNLIHPGRGSGMHDGWETRRRRGPGHDWAVIRLGAEGSIARVVIDTLHFKGNSPDRFALLGGPTPEGPWEEVLPETRLEPHTRHIFYEGLKSSRPFAFARLHIYPDGGVSRLCLFGTISEQGKIDRRLHRLNSLLPELCEKELLACCGSKRWAAAMAASRPFEDAAALNHAAPNAFANLDREDWLEAFRAHPKIGQRTGAGWASGEQAGMASAADELKQRMDTLNRAYEERFGHIYIVCATGRSGAEMLALLEERMSNDPERELTIAAGEQQKITALRLDKLLGGKT